MTTTSPSTIILLLVTTISVAVVVVLGSSTPPATTTDRHHPYRPVVAVPSRLRRPIDRWVSQFQLAMAYEEHLAPNKVSNDRDHDKGIRYIFTELESSSSSGKQNNGEEQQEKREHGAEADEKNPFWSGRATEDPVLALEFNQAVVDKTHPDHSDSQDKSPLRRMTVVLNEHSWGVQCFQAKLHNLDTNNQLISKSVIKCPEPNARRIKLDLPLPPEEQIKEAWTATSDPSATMKHLWQITVTFEQAVTTSYSFLSETGLGKEVMTSGEKYDVTPDNASMGFKFMVQSSRESGFEMWAFRKPPMPDFRLSMYVDGDVVFSEPIIGVGQTANAFGVKHEIEERSIVNFTSHPVAMYAVFVEQRRQFSFKVRSDNLAEALAPLFDDSSKKEGSNFHEVILRAKMDDDEPLPFADIPQEIRDNVTVHFRRFEHAKTIGVYVSFPHSVKNTMVSFYMLQKEDDEANHVKKGERVHLFMRENDAEVPDPASYDHLYGWDDAMPLDSSSSSMKLHSILSAPIEIEVRFDQTEAPSHGTIAGLMERWISNAGGHCNKVNLSFLDVPHHSHARAHDVTTLAVFPAWKDVTRKKTNQTSSSEHHQDGDADDDDYDHTQHVAHLKHAIVAIPMYNIFTASLATSTGWGAIVKQKQQNLDDWIKEENLHPDSVQFMYLTLATMSHVYDGSHNFRVLFSAFEQSAVNLPPLYHTEELKLFSFSDAFAFERSRMLSFWEEEYAVLTRTANKMRREITKEMYFFHRSQVEARSINGTNGEMQLIPVVDMFPHSDHPNAEVVYDHETGHVLVVASKALARNTPVTIDFGTGHQQATKTALGFLLQHGFIPDGAHKSVGIVMKELVEPHREKIFTLVNNVKHSSEEVLRWIHNGQRFDKPTTTGEQEPPAATFNELGDARQKLRDIVEGKLNELPSEIPDVSDEALVAGEKAKVAARSGSSHHHHHRHHKAHQERDLDHLRASFDAARENAQKLLEAERTTLKYFFDVLKV